MRLVHPPPRRICLGHTHRCTRVSGVRVNRRRGQPSRCRYFDRRLRGSAIGALLTSCLANCMSSFQELLGLAIYLLPPDGMRAVHRIRRCSGVARVLPCSVDRVSNGRALRPSIRAYTMSAGFQGSGADKLAVSC